MSENFFEVPQEFADALNNGMKQDGNIELPFSAPLLWWKNGDPAMKPLTQSAPGLYFGGWAVETERMDEVKAERGLPAGFVQTEVINREGKSIPSYVARVIVAAPLGYRYCWKSKDMNGVRSQKYFKGASQHVQLLAMLASRNEKDYIAWGPVILSAKGYQSKYLLDAVNTWPKTISNMRKEHAPNTPAWAFWMGVGTFGSAIKTKMVGNGSQSPITPIELFQPEADKFDLEMFKKLFVGKVTIEKMADYISQAQEWLNAWKTPGAVEAAHEFTDEVSSQEPAYDDIPF